MNSIYTSTKICESEDFKVLGKSVANIDLVEVSELQLFNCTGFRLLYDVDITNGTRFSLGNFFMLFNSNTDNCSIVKSYK